MKHGGNMNTIRFENEEQRKVFRMKMALNVLQQETVNADVGIRFYRGSILKVLKRYFPELPRTRKAAYEYLKRLGHYE